jgi:hypothetical protein
MVADNSITSDYGSTMVADLLPAIIGSSICIQWLKTTHCWFKLPAILTNYLSLEIM